MKKRVRILALVLSLLMLAGCGSAQGQEEQPDSGADQGKEETVPVLTPWEDEDTTDKVKMYFFSVDVESWGDCTYLEFPNGENMLVDTGLPAATALIVERLMDEGVDEIDHLILTHSHSDHVKGLSSILANMKVNHAYYTGYWTTDFTWVERNLTTMGVTQHKVAAGDSFSVGDVKFDVIWPLKEDIAVQCTGASNATNGPGGTVDVNNKSMVFTVTYGNNKAMFTADAYTASQNRMLGIYDASVLDCDILKIAHHGYENAACEAFVAAVSPQYAVSMGTATMNSMVYNHYKKVGCVAYLSWMNGCTYVTMDGTNVTCTPENPEIKEYYQLGVG